MHTQVLRTLFVASVLVGAAQSARAQNDNCATPDVISGTGIFAFSNAGATGSMPGGGFCPNIGSDVWFRWTSTQSGLATFHTCGQVAHDSAIAVYPVSTCPGAGSSLACDDDACGLESLVTFTAVAGGTYMLQLGSSGGGPGGNGTFTIDIQGPPANDDCSGAIVITGQGGGNYDSTIATHSPQGFGHACGDVTSDVWYEWTAPQNGTATVDTCFQSNMDTAVNIFLGSGCPSGAPIACNDDGCSFQSSVTWPITVGTTYMIEVGNANFAPSGVGSFVLTLSGPPPTGVPFCSGDGTGTACPCGNVGAPGAGCAHSAGSGGVLDATGTASVSNDSVVLQGSNMPPTSPALYFQGTASQGAGLGVVFGDGLRCVGGTVIRLGTKTNAGGASSYGGPAGDVPISIRGALPGIGGTRMYQCWFRNAATFCTASTFNLTNGFEIAWGS